MKRRPRIWIPEAPMLNLRRTYREVSGLEASIQLEGWFEVELIHKASGLVSRRERFRNIITDMGLNVAVSVPILYLLNECGVGSGTAEPAPTDTNLEIPATRTNNAGGFDDITGYDPDNNDYSFFRRTRVFSTAQANGNLTEVGMFGAGSNSEVMFCRQLIRDASGNPTAITKTNEYELRVTYEIRVYPTRDVIEYTALVNGSHQTVKRKPANWGGAGSRWGFFSNAGNAIAHFAGSLPTNDLRVFTGPLSPDESRPSGSSYPLTAVSQTAYVTGSFERSYTAEWGASAANNTLLSFVTAGSNFSASGQWLYQHELETPVTKNNTQKLVLEVMRSWGRYEP